MKSLERPRKLTPRQREVLRLLHAERTTSEMVRELHISEDTLRTHIRGIREAYGTCTYKEALKRAQAEGEV